MASTPVKTGIFAGGVILVLLAVIIGSRGSRISGHSAERSPSATPADIVSTGKILGVEIGSRVEDARAILDPLRLAGSSEFREKETAEREEGRRLYWRLNGTDYDWIIISTNEEGRVVQISANLRPQRHKPFSEIGDLARSTRTKDGAAIWTMGGTNKPGYRVVARGLRQHASSVRIEMSATQSDEPAP